MRRQARFFLLLLCLVVLSGSVGGQQPSTVNLRSRSIASDPGIPQVRVTVDQRRVPLGTPVTFSLTPASIVNDSRYVVTLYFGDRQTEVMWTPQTVHVYQAVGNYTYAVDVKHRQPPGHNDPDKPPQSVPRVTLNASPVLVLETEPVNFSAQLSRSYPNIQYRFVFGDGRSTAWQTGAQAQHSYARAGNYFAYVDISDGKNRLGGSPRKRLNVMPAQRVSVSLTATPLAARLGKPVTFTAKASPVRADARYLFNFGDGQQTSWQADRQAQHTYKTRGIYRPYVQVSQFLNNQNLSATSMPTVLRVRSAPGPTPEPRPSPSPTTTPTPGPSPSPTPVTSPTASDSPTPSPVNGSPSPTPSPSGSNGTTVTGSETLLPTASRSPNQPDDTAPGKTWWYLLIAAAILFVIYQASGLLFAAQPTFAPFADHGVAAIAHEKGALPIDFQLVLDPNVSGGDYSVTTDQPRLVTNAPEPEDRQIIEI
jgi:hypothetical protein